MPMSKIVRTTAQIITPAIVLYGMYLIVHGHASSGGGFQGGAVFASSAVLLVVAFGASRVAPHLRENALMVLCSCGALLFILLAFAGMGNTFFHNLLVGSPVFGNVPEFGSTPLDLWTGGTVPLMNFAVAMNVIGGLAAIVLAMALSSSEKGGDE